VRRQSDARVVCDRAVAGWLTAHALPRPQARHAPCAVTSRSQHPVTTHWAGEWSQQCRSTGYGRWSCDRAVRCAGSVVSGVLGVQGGPRVGIGARCQQRRGGRSAAADTARLVQAFEVPSGRVVFPGQTVYERCQGLLAVVCGQAGRGDPGAVRAALRRRRVQAARAVPATRRGEWLTAPRTPQVVIPHDACIHRQLHSARSPGSRLTLRDRGDVAVFPLWSAPGPGPAGGVCGTDLESLAPLPSTGRRRHRRCRCALRLRQLAPGGGARVSSPQPYPLARPRPETSVARAGGRRRR